MLYWLLISSSAQHVSGWAWGKSCVVPPLSELIVIVPRLIVLGFGECADGWTDRSEPEILCGTSDKSGTMENSAM